MNQEPAMRFIVRGVPQQVADEVRRTHIAPGYGHPAHLELARGTGPCRCCLRPFMAGQEQRLLFTFRPGGAAGSLLAPGPVFIHAEHCDEFDGEGFPNELRALPLAYEGRASGSRVTALIASSDLSAESQIETMFADPQAEWLHVRHAEAGCYIARVDRAE
jgi:hypothetical protein